VLVVEGYMDVVGLAQFGVGNAVATLGTAATPHHIQKLLRLTDRVVFCFDGDAAGRRAAGRALEVSLEHLADNKTLSFLFLPEEHDPDSFVRAEGPDAFRAAMNRALPLAEFLLAELKKDIDLGTAEGCARLVHEAKPLVTRIAAPLLRLQVIKMLAEAAGFTQAEVEQSFGLKAGRRAASTTTALRRRLQGRRDFRRPPRNALPRLAPRSARRRRRPLETAQAGHPAPGVGRPPAHRPAARRQPRRPGPARHRRRPERRRPAHPRHRRPARTLPGQPHAEAIDRMAGQLADSPFDEATIEPLLNDTLKKLEADAVSREIDALNARERETG
jgi:DNA primase